MESWRWGPAKVQAAVCVHRTRCPHSMLFRINAHNGKIIIAQVDIGPCLPGILIRAGCHVSCVCAEHSLAIMVHGRDRAEHVMADIGARLYF